MSIGNCSPNLTFATECIRDTSSKHKSKSLSIFFFPSVTRQENSAVRQKPLKTCCQYLPIIYPTGLASNVALTVVSLNSNFNGGRFLPDIRTTGGIHSSSYNSTCIFVLRAKTRRDDPPSVQPRVLA